jgi:hypothetical protein
VLQFEPRGSTGAQQFVVNYGNGYKGTNHNMVNAV